MSVILSVPQQYPASAEESSADWKRQLAERLDAYRAKHPEADSPTCPAHHARGDSRASEIARSVASRYASVPTYEELLQAAVQAERAAAEAQAALVERVASDARLQREQELAESGNGVRRFTSDEISEVSGPKQTEDPGLSSPVGPCTPVMPRIAGRQQEMHLHQQEAEPEPSREDFWKSALFEPRTLLPSKLIEFPRELVSSRRAKLPPPEIASRAELGSQAPDPEPSQLRIFEAEPPSTPESSSESESVDSMSAPAQTAQARTSQARTTQARTAQVDESTREIAARHPLEAEREAEAPVRDAPAQTGDHGHRAHPLPIRFENPALAGVKSADRGRDRRFIPSRPGRTGPTALPVGTGSYGSAARAFRNLEWAAISLDEEPAAAVQEARVSDAIPFLTDAASIQRRVMALAVDFCAVTAGFLAFLLVFAATTSHFPSGSGALVLGGVVYACLWLLYQALFFSLGGSTAGMLYARIALCTFEDRNPTRLALRHRLAAWWLSCLPVGIGFLWSFFDEDNLSWHDRMTRTYQREY